MKSVAAFFEIVLMKGRTLPYCRTCGLAAGSSVRISHHRVCLPRGQGSIPGRILSVRHIGSNSKIRSILQLRISYGIAFCSAVCIFVACYFRFFFPQGIVYSFFVIVLRRSIGICIGRWWRVLLLYQTLSRPLLRRVLHIGLIRLVRLLCQLVGRMHLL